MKKTISYLSKILFIALFAIAGVVLSGNIGIKAEDGDELSKTVRVSTMKQLQKAINDPEVSRIIFRTREMDTFTIKANKNAKDKTLLIDAPNASVINKANFLEINIENFLNYYEKVSGNQINVYYDISLMHSFKIGKNKEVEGLTIITPDVITDSHNFYNLMKGARIDKVDIVYYGLSDLTFSTTDYEKNEISIQYTDDDHNDRSYIIKLDSRGRIKEMISNATYNYNYKFKYNKNGKWIKLTGSDDDDKNIVFTKEYNGEYILKENFKSDNWSFAYEYFYNDDSYYRSPYKVTYVKKTKDAEESLVKTYTYDNKNRIATEHAEYSEGNTVDIEYYFNKKDLAVKDVYNYYDAEGEKVGETITLLYEYNKFGDITKETTIEGDNEISEAYEYDDLGYVTNIIALY